jgi:hypothetical protein
MDGGRAAEPPDGRNLSITPPPDPRNAKTPDFSEVFYYVTKNRPN